MKREYMELELQVLQWKENDVISTSGEPEQEKDKEVEWNGAWTLFK